MYYLDPFGQVLHMSAWEIMKQSCKVDFAKIHTGCDRTLSAIDAMFPQKAAEAPENMQSALDFCSIRAWNKG